MDKKETQGNAPAQAENKPGFVDVFIGGSKQGIGVWLHALMPGIVFGYMFTQLLQVSGILTVIGKVCGPIMAIFGLPGEAATAFITSFFSLIGGMSATASMVTNGVLNGTHATILFPMMFCVGSSIQFLGRMLAVAGVSGKKYWVNFVIGIICAAVAGLVMRFIA